MLGGIDLSIQAMASLASVIVALTIDRLGYGSASRWRCSSAPLAGLAGGLAHVRLRIPSFIATLAMGGVLAGTALVISQARVDHAGRGASAATLAWVTGTSLRHPARDLHRRRRADRRPRPAEPHPLRPLQRRHRRRRAAAYASGVKVDRQKVLALTSCPAPSPALAGVDPRRPPRQRLADAGQRAAAAGDRRRGGRRHRDHRRRRQHLAHR